MIPESQLEAFLRGKALDPPSYEWTSTVRDETRLSKSGMFRSNEKLSVNVHPTGYTPPIPPGMTAPAPHSHEFIEISYLWSGTCYISVEDECIEMNAGDFIMLDTCSVHDPAVSKDSILINIAVDPVFFDENFFNNFDRNDALADFFASSIYSQKAIKRYITFRPEDDRRVRKLIAMLVTEFYSDEVCRVKVMENLMMVFFSTMVRLHLQHHAQLTCHQGETGIVPELLRYMNEHLQAVSRDSVAEHFGYSYSYISSVLQSATGMSFSKLKNSLRLNRAEMLLRTTDGPITSIARSAGFTNVTSFYEMFHRQFGVSPNEYRLKTRAQPSGSSHSEG